MEADCASLSAPDRARARIARARCRLAEAERRRWRLSGVIADLPDPLDRLRPEVEIILPVRPPGGPIRPRPREGRTPG